MDKYITFIASGVFDLKSQLNMNAANGYVLALMKIQLEVYESGGSHTAQYVVIMEHQSPKQLDEKFPPFNVKKEGKESTDDANS